VVSKGIATQNPNLSWSEQKRANISSRPRFYEGTIASEKRTYRSIGSCCVKPNQKIDEYSRPRQAQHRGVARSHPQTRTKPCIGRGVKAERQHLPNPIRTCVRKMKRRACMLSQKRRRIDMQSEAHGQPLPLLWSCPCASNSVRSSY
jgi:hypothetical protein